MLPRGCLVPGDVEIQQHKTAAKICSHFSAHTHAMDPSSFLCHRLFWFVHGTINVLWPICHLSCCQRTWRMRAWWLSLRGHYDVMGVASPLLTAHSCLDISLLTPVPNWPGLGAANWLLPGKQPTQLSHQPGHWEGPSLVTSHWCCLLRVIWSPGVISDSSGHPWLQLVSIFQNAKSNRVKLTRRYQVLLLTIQQTNSQ